MSIQAVETECSPNSGGATHAYSTDLQNTLSEDICMYDYVCMHVCIYIITYIYNYIYIYIIYWDIETRGGVFTFNLFQPKASTVAPNSVLPVDGWEAEEPPLVAEAPQETVVKSTLRMSAVTKIQSTSGILHSKHVESTLFKWKAWKPFWVSLATVRTFVRRRDNMG